MAHANLSHIQELVEKLWRVTRDPPHNFQVNEDLAELRRMVQTIQAVLNDAEKMEIKVESVRFWLKDLKGLAYDAEDVLDEYNCELLQHHAESESTITAVSLDASFCGEIADKIRKIRDRFEGISKRCDALHLREDDGQKRSPVIAHRPPSSHIVDAPEIYGRKDDLEKVIDRLLYSDECKKSNLLVLPIVGMGGVGKTTLVQHVYNDSRICDHFQMKGWVCVSDDFTIEKLTERIFESLTKGLCDVKEFSVIQERLIKSLDGRRFLLVLDDVWNEDPALWEILQKPLRFGVEGSAVITTTRSEVVAKIMKTMPFHCLNCLSFNDCLAVFIKSAFVDRDLDDHPDLMKIGKEIVGKCGGLPLAAKSLGGLLSYKNDADEWGEVLHSDIWDLHDQGDRIIPALRLSYLHLPSYLKQCFLYAAVFPKDFKIGKVELILLWMAQGFLQCKGSKQAEDFGNKYFNELVQRSLFQYCPESSAEYPFFVMHDLIHDLAQHISGGEFFHMDRDKARILHSNEVRHVSAIHQRVEVLEKMSHAPWANIIRTLMVRGTLGAQWKFPNQMMPHLGFLRTLHLGYSGIGELPDSVGKLKHLRYLNLDGNAIERLPDSVCKLYSLQTLSLVDCEDLRRLPKDIGNLCNLRHLNIEGTDFDLLPSGFGKLTSLHALDVFPVLYRCWPICPEDYLGTEEELNGLSLLNHGLGPGCGLIRPSTSYSVTAIVLSNLSLVSNEEGCGIEGLKDLIHLRGTLCIPNLEYVMDAEDARLTDLRNKRGIRKLILEWYAISKWYCSEAASPEVQTQVLENLQPPDRLEELKIRDYDGLRLPDWMGDDPSSLSKLVRVELYGCRQCTTLPALGQLPSLKHLEITRMPMVAAVGPEFRGDASVGFPALEELTLRCMASWVTWESAAQRGDFPRLRLLTVDGCKKLKSMVPLYLLPALQELAIYRCGELSINLWGRPPPPLRTMIITDCPRACFSPEDDEHLSLPPALCDLTIVDAPLMVEWCEGGGGTRLAHIPNAKILRTEPKAVGGKWTYVHTWPYLGGPGTTSVHHVYV